MLESITYFQIFGKPVIMYLGILTLLCLSFTALIGFLNYRGIRIIPFKWHPLMAAITITLAIIHGLLGVLSYF